MKKRSTYKIPDKRQYPELLDRNRPTTWESDYASVRRSGISSEKLRSIANAVAFRKHY